MTLGRRLAVIMVIAVWSCIAIYGWLGLNQRRANLLNDALADAREVGSTLDVVLNDLLRHQPLEELEGLPDEISRAGRIHGLAILDSSSGLLIASRNARLYEQQIRALAHRALTAGHPIGLDMTVGRNVAAYAFPLRRDGHQVLGAAVVLRDLSHVEPLVNRSRWRVATLGVALAIVATIISLAVSRSTLAKPVAALIAGVRRVGDGNLSVPIPVERDDEVGSIARALNQMMADLVRANARSDLETSARVELARSVEDERKMQHAQRLAAIGQIAASLAHEIGSPLHVIAGRARFAAESDDPKELRENLRVIATQADRITRVVQQLLTIGRRRGPRLETVSLEAVAQTAVELLGPQARQQGVKLVLENRVSDPAKGRTIGDPDQLQQVLFNLVMNALQAQSKGGEVTVAIDQVEERDSLANLRQRVAVEVCDRGPGVPEAKREQIFEAFATDRVEQGGTGLGLAVVRGIVREHNGTVRVLDRPGGGAIFRVVLPVDDEPEERRPARRDERARVEPANAEPETAAHPAAPSVQTQPTDNPKRGEESPAP